VKWKHELDENYINIGRQPGSDEYAAVAADEDIKLNYSRLLDGRVCIVTGSSYGMGFSMAKLYAQHGARLIMTARNEEKLNKAADDIRKEIPDADILTMAFDMCDRDKCDDMMAKVKEKYGRLDVLLNNAGMGDQWRIEEMPDEIMDYIFELNLKGPMRLCRAALKIMLPQEYGRIVNVASVNGIRPMCGAAYTASKGALNMLTKNIAIRCVGTGVNCNSLCPGFTVTPLALEQEKGGESSRLAPAGKDMIPILHERTVRNAPTFPIDQANLALFLGSDMSRGVNGQLIVCDNGQFL